MVEIFSHKIQYKIVFTTPVDYFDVVLQKQIDLRQKFTINEDFVIVLHLELDKRFSESEFLKKFIFFDDTQLFRFSFLKLNDSPNKYTEIKRLYNDNFANRHYQYRLNIKTYEEFEYYIELMLEEFKLFLDHFEFNENEKKIINAFVMDDNLKSNIKFIGWEDYVG